MASNELRLKKVKVAMNESLVWKVRANKL